MNRTATANTNGPAAPAVETQAEPSLLERVVEATQQARRFDIEEIRYMAKAGSASGMYGMSEAQAFTLMMICEADGLHPIQALRRFHMMKFRGKDGVERVTATLKAAAILAEMQRGGWVVEWTVECDDQVKQEAFFSHSRKCPKGKHVRFTVEDAERAELLSGRNADNWRKYRANMLRARVISNACYMLDPGITQGFYTPEEVSDFDDRPSPRPLPADAPASRVEPAAATAEAPAELAPQPANSLNFTGKDWVQALINEYEGDWAAFCVQEGKPHTKLVENIWQAINGVVSKWVEDDPREKEHVEVKGVRKKGKVAVRVGQAFESDRHETEEDFRLYLNHKWEEAATALGINMDAQPPEEVIT